LISSSYKIKTYWNIFINMGLSRPPPEGSEIQDGAHFTTTRLVRAGIS